MADGHCCLWRDSQAGHELWPGNVTPPPRVGKTGHTQQEFPTPSLVCRAGANSRAETPARAHTSSSMKHTAALTNLSWPGRGNRLQAASPLHIHFQLRGGSTTERHSSTDVNPIPDRTPSSSCSSPPSWCTTHGSNHAGCCFRKTACWRPFHSFRQRPNDNMSASDGEDRGVRHGEIGRAHV